MVFVNKRGVALINKCIKLAQQINLTVHCMFCGSWTDVRQNICKQCVNWLPWNKRCCKVCALPISSTNSRCSACFEGEWAFEKVISPFTYSYPIVDVIQKIKFQQNFKLINILMQSAHKEIQNQWLSKIVEQPDLLLAVPLNLARQRERGFNQATLIAHNLSNLFDIAIYNNVVAKTTQTTAQALSNKKNRKFNLQNAFKVTRNLNSLHLMIVDDVMTTGATVHSLAKSLKANGAKQVSVFVLARTLK